MRSLNQRMIHLLFFPLLPVLTFPFVLFISSINDSNKMSIVFRMGRYWLFQGKLPSLFSHPISVPYSFHSFSNGWFLIFLFLHLSFFPNSSPISISILSRRFHWWSSQVSFHISLNYSLIHSVRFSIDSSLLLLQREQLSSFSLLVGRMVCIIHSVQSIDSLM